MATALSLIFESGHNITRFYMLRRYLGIGKGDPTAILDEMEAIARREIEISTALIPITTRDTRIGYHSEAHGYKIFPEKLRWRIGEVETVLREEFPAVRKRIADGLCPLAFYRGEDEGSRAYTVRRAPIEECAWWPFVDKDGNEAPNTAVRAAETEDGYLMEFRILGDGMIWLKPEFRMFHPYLKFGISEQGIHIGNDIQFSVYGGRALEIKRRFGFDRRPCEGGQIITLSFRRADFDMEKGEPFRLDAERSGEDTYLAAPDRIYRRLTLGTFSPDSYAFFVPEK